MPYLVATDLDGTLLRRDFSVSERTRQALKAAQHAGVEVVFATGRPPRWLPEVYTATGIHPVTVCANGALTLQDGQPLAIRDIPQSAVDEVCEILAGIRGDFVFRREQWEGHTLKLLASVPNGRPGHADELLAEVQAVASHLVEATHSAHGQLLIEMGPSGVTKARALQELREQRWPQHTLVAIGDMPNDLAMLRAADIPVTVASGHPVLKAVAERVLPGPDEDGVAQLLEELALDGALH